MFSLSSPPACRKRKSSLKAPLTPNKRARLVGSFEPRLIVPTGARRSWTFAKVSRFILDPVTQGAKRSLIEEDITSSPSNCKVRLLDNRDALFLPSQERRATKKPQRKRSLSSSPVKKSVEFVRLRRREFIRQRQLQRIDSGICMESDEDLDLDLNTLFEPMSSLEPGEDIKFFGGIDASSFSGFSVEMMEATETATEDDMEIEDASISTTTSTASTSEGDADSDPTRTKQTTSSSKDDDNKEASDKGMPVDEKEEKGEVKESGNDVEVEDAEEQISEQQETNKLSTKDTVIKERIRKRLGVDELVRLSSTSPKRGVIKKVAVEEDDDEDDEPPRRSTRRKTVKSYLPTTVEEEEEDEKERDDDDDAVVVKRRSSKSSSKGKEEEKERKEKVDESDREEKKGEKKEKKKLVRRKAKTEESESSESEKEEEKKPKKEKKEVKQEEKKEEEKVEEIEEEEVEGDKMEEDTDEGSTSSGEDTDMSTDEDVTDFISEDKAAVEDLVEEDVTMSEDDEMAEEVSEDQKEEEEKVNAETTPKDEESKDIETADANEAESSEKEKNNFLQVPAIEVKKTVRRLVLTSKNEEYEISKMLSAPRTPRTPGPRSPNMSRFNITMSKAPRKLDPLLSPRRKKFIKSEDLSPHWTMKRLATQKREQPFNPANISRHAYRDPINEDELYNLATRKAFWDEDELEEPYADEQYLRVEWTRKSWSNSWMMENGCALIDFCVRALEGFNMAW